MSARFQLSLFTDEEIQLRVVEHVFLTDSSLLDNEKFRVKNTSNNMEGRIPRNNSYYLSCDVVNDLL